MLKIKLIYFLIVLSVLTFNSKAIAQSPTTNTTFDKDKALQEIVAQNKLFSHALATSDSLQVASIYTQDAKIFNHAMPTTTGRSGIESFYGSLIRAGITKFDYTTTDVSGSDNNLVMEEGTLSFAFPDGKVVSKGRYLLVWRRKGDKLKIFRDSFSLDGKSK